MKIISWSIVYAVLVEVKTWIAASYIDRNRKSSSRSNMYALQIWQIYIKQIGHL